MSELISPDAMMGLFQVLMIDLAPAADDAIIGLAAAGLPQAQRAAGRRAQSLHASLGGAR